MEPDQNYGATLGKELKCLSEKGKKTAAGYDFTREIVKYIYRNSNLSREIARYIFRNYELPRQIVRHITRKRILALESILTEQK